MRSTAPSSLWRWVCNVKGSCLLHVFLIASTSFQSMQCLYQYSAQPRRLFLVSTPIIVSLVSTPTRHTYSLFFSLWSQYPNFFRGIFPLKVCQHRRVVEEIMSGGGPFHYGLQCGSMPELLVILAYLKSETAVITCNGFKGTRDQIGLSQ